MKTTLHPNVINHIVKTTFGPRPRYTRVAKQELLLFLSADDMATFIEGIAYENGENFWEHFLTDGRHIFGRNPNFVLDWLPV